MVACAVGAYVAPRRNGFERLGRWQLADFKVIYTKGANRLAPNVPGTCRGLSSGVQRKTAFALEDEARVSDSSHSLGRPKSQHRYRVRQPRREASAGSHDRPRCVPWRSNRPSRYRSILRMRELPRSASREPAPRLNETVSRSKHWASPPHQVSWRALARRY